VREIMWITSKLDSKWIKELLARRKSVDTANLADRRMNMIHCGEEERILKRTRREKRIEEMIRLKRLEEELWTERK